MTALTDLELTRACAIAMGYTLDEFSLGWRVRMEGDVFAIIPAPGTHPSIGTYDPLTNDAQCFALVKKFRLRISWNDLTGACMVLTRHEDSAVAPSDDLNRAIVTCVANIASERGEGESK